MCVRLAHLELGTHRDNMLDKLRVGTTRKENWTLSIGPRRPHYLLGRGWTRRIFRQTETIYARGWPMHAHLCVHRTEVCLPAAISDACWHEEVARA
jgi:hypothetical protein